MYLRKHPLCADCAEYGQATAATEVHHMIALRDGGSHDECNLLALCHRCHSRRTGHGQ